jgi:metallo-beta-lactamase family protein
MFDLSFLGAAETVTGSKYLLSTDDRNILVDCGLFQGIKKRRNRNWRDPPVDPREIDAVVLTHAHIDHTGFLPRFINEGFDGPVYCTEATRDLLEILLPDAGYLQEEQAKYANRKGFSEHDPAQPLYTRDDAERALDYLEPEPFGESGNHTSDVVDLGDGIQCRFTPAGHILGAAWVSFDLRGRKLVFSGDVGRPNDPIMRSPRPIDHADYLVLESTYGDRRHAEVDVEQQLAEVVNRTVDRGGVVVIPAFAVGRSQSLMHLLTELQNDDRIPDLPVFLNSPMAIDVSQLYRKHAKLHRLSDQQCDEMFANVTFVNDVQASKKLNTRQDPAVIISASGMATGGRVVHHLKTLAPDPKNTILFAGFQAPGTRGDSMVAGADSVKIHGKYIPIEADVVDLEGVSAHADYVEIGDWLESLDHAPNEVFLTHGEPAATDAMRRYVRDRFEWNCSIPDLHDRRELG